MIAWETLLSGNPLFKRSWVEREVGSDAFDYGFLIGNEGLIGDFKADIYITFAHRSIQEFFGAFFFVLQLIEGKDIDGLLGTSRKDPIFMKNPLFLHFMFWFLSEKRKTDYFPLGNTDKACEILDSYIYNKIFRLLGSTQLTQEFPAIDFQRAFDSKDNINIEHFKRMLERFKNIKYLVHGGDAFHDWILNHILPTCHTLKVMIEDELLSDVNPELLKSGGNTTNVLLSDKAYTAGVLEYLCEVAVQFNRQLVVYFFVTLYDIDLSNVLHRDIKELHIVGTGQVATAILAWNLISTPFLTHLSVIGHVRLDPSVMSVIRKEVREGKLPRLQSLSFPGMNLKGQLKNLLDEKANLTNMTQLNLAHCDLDKKDLEALCFASNNGLLPSLMSLGLDYRLFTSGEKNIFAQNWGNLTSLSVKPLTKLGFKNLMKGIGQRKLTNLNKLCLLMMQNETCNLGKLQLNNKLPHLEHVSLQRCVTSKENLKHVSRMLTHWILQTLDISHSRGITGELSTLTRQDLRSLRNLTLHDYELNGKDMENLAQANEKGKLSNLDNLDLSENYYLTAKFGAYSSQWFNLRKLKINNTRDELSSISGLPVHLPVIKELRITGENSIHIWRGCLEHLEKLDIVVLRSQLSDILPSLVRKVEDGSLPALRTVWFLPYDASLSIMDDILAKLSKNGVDICIVNLNPEIDTGWTE